MKLNIADNKGSGMVKQFEITDDQLRRVNLTDYQLGSDIDGEVFGDQFKGYVFRLRGGSDKDGFPMVPGVLVPSRVSLLVKRGAIGFNTFRGRSGERRRKNVRGAIVASDIAVLNVTISRKGEAEIEGLTDTVVAKRIGPKRAGKIRKLFNLGRDADLSKVVMRRRVVKEGKKDRLKAPKIQRLITPKIKARRAKKATLMIEKVRKSTEERRQYLKAIAAERRSRRQRYHAKKHNKKIAQQNAEVAAMKH